MNKTTLSLMSLAIFLGSSFAAGRSVPLVVNHSYDLADLPAGVVAKMEASAPMVHYAHRSDGSAVPFGLEALNSLDAMLYPFASADLALPTAKSGIRFWNGMSANNYVTPDLYWQTKAGRDDLSLILNRNSEIQFASWTWCNEDDYYGLGDPANGQGLGSYFRTMDSLEKVFVQVTFIYQTAAIRDAGSDASNIHQAIFNDSLRRWAVSHNKILFDVSDLDAWHAGDFHTESFALSALKDTVVQFVHPAWAEGFGPTNNGHHANDSMGVDKGKAWIYLMSRLYMEKQGIASSAIGASSSESEISSSSGYSLRVRDGEIYIRRMSSTSTMNFDLRGRRIF